MSQDMRSLLEKIYQLNEFRRVSEPVTSVYHFPLDNAYLCGNCENVTNSSHTCPSCASESLYPVNDLIGGSVRLHK